MFQIRPNQEVLGSLAGVQPLDVMRSTRSMQEYGDRTESAFLISTVLNRGEQGQVSLVAAVYSCRSQSLLLVESHTYADPDQAALLVPELGRALSHPRNFSAGDTAFFYSILLPGAGQARLGRWDHALFSAGLVASAILYGVTAPEPDRYTVGRDYFDERYDYATASWHFFVAGAEVSHEEYFESFRVASTRAQRALQQRIDYDSRRKTAVQLTVGAWVLNLLDTLLVSGRAVDGAPFFNLVGSLPGEGGRPRLAEVGVRIRFRIPW
jgi:hypothetical protein